MKLVLVLSLAFFGVTAQAASFQCTAQGYDHKQVRQTVEGFVRYSQGEAEQSAIDSCRLRGLTACYVTICRSWN